MGKYVDGVIDSVSKSLDLRLWFHFLITGIFYAIVLGIIAVVFALIGIFAVSSAMGIDLLGVISGFVSTGTVSQEIYTNLMLAFLSPEIVLNIVLVGMVLLVVFLVFSMIVDSFFQAVYYFLARDFWDTKTIDLGIAFGNAKQRFFSLFKVQLILGIVIGIFALIVFSPILFSLPGLLNSLPEILSAGSSGAGFAGVFLVLALLIVLMLFFSLVLFFASPFLSMMIPSVLFGNLGAVDSIKNAVEIVKGKYLATLAFILLLGIVLGIISMVFGGIIVFFQVLGMLAVPLMVLMVFLRIILQIVFNVWIGSVQTLGFVKLFDLNTGPSKPKRKGFVGVIAK